MQCPQVSLQVEKKNAVLHFVMLSRCVITSTWQNAGSWSSHGSDAGPGEGEGGGSGEGGGNGDSDGGGGGEGERGGGEPGGSGGGEGDGSGGGRVQYPQLSLQVEKKCGVLHLVIKSSLVVTSRGQNSGSWSAHAADGGLSEGEGEDGEGEGGGAEAGGGCIGGVHAALALL